MSNTARVRAHLKLGPATHDEIAKALKMGRDQVVYAIQGLKYHEEIVSVHRKPADGGRLEALYAIAGTPLPPATSQTIVATALANEPDLARVWK